MNAALYVRRSTNEKMQADSLRVQEKLLRKYAKERDMNVVRVYADSASGTTARRPAFEEMTSHITHGANFEVVLVRDVSRFGRFFDVDEGAFWEQLFKSHSVQVDYVEEVFGTAVSPMAGLMKNIRRVMASESSRDRSRMVRYTQARTAKLGFHRGGPAPYGMRRVMVTRSGERVCDLNKGEWKALSNRKTKLVLGPLAEVEVVRLVFNMYASGSGMAEICSHLNDTGIPAPRGGRWWMPTILNMLDNATYVGAAKFTMRSKGLCDTELEPELQNVITDGSFDPLIQRDVWDRVQARMRRFTLRKTDADLAANARAAYERHGCAEARMFDGVEAPCSWATYANRFPIGAIDGALELAYGSECEQLFDSAVAALAAVLGVRRNGEQIEVQNGTILAIRPVFLRGQRHGHYWRFDHRRFAASDIVIAVFVGPTRIQRWAVLKTNRLDGRERGLFVRHNSPDEGRMLLSDEAMVARVEKLARQSRGSVQTFTQLLQSKPLANFAEIARELGWPHHVVRKLYGRLKAGGVPLPPLQYKSDRRIAVVCEKCGNTRTLAPNRALQLKTSVCFRCMCDRPKTLVQCSCPECGRVAHRYPSAVKQMTEGAHTICRNCRIRKYALARKR